MRFFITFWSHTLEKTGHISKVRTYFEIKTEFFRNKITWPYGGVAVSITKQQETKKWKNVCDARFSYHRQTQ